MNTKLIGVDGCPGGWICVTKEGQRISVAICQTAREILAANAAVVAIDVPIGLPDRGPRACDIEARKLLGKPRASSVFPAPVRAVLNSDTFERAGSIHRKVDGRGITKQSFAILEKIREVDAAVKAQDSHQRSVREIHPEVCFKFWNGGVSMKHNKKRSLGRQEREALIGRTWPGVRERLAAELRGQDWGQDDLNDALAALWTADRIHRRQATCIPAQPVSDSAGLRMEMWA